MRKLGQFSPTYLYKGQTLMCLFKKMEQQYRAKERQMESSSICDDAIFFFFYWKFDVILEIRTSSIQKLGESFSKFSSIHLLFNKYLLSAYIRHCFRNLELSKEQKSLPLSSIFTSWEELSKQYNTKEIIVKKTTTIASLR